MDTAQVDKVLRETADDERFSRAERRDVRDWVAARGLNQEQRKFVQHRAFEIARTMDDSAAAMSWLEGVIKALFADAFKPDNEAPMSVYFSPGETCLRAIQGELGRAQKRADICVFTITDNRISEAIVGAHRRGVVLRIISDNYKAEDRGSDIDALEQAGVPLRLDRSEHHMHHKYALFDEGRLLTGSYNWTRSASLHNQENLLITEAPAAVVPYRDHFDALWAHLA